MTDINDLSDRYVDAFAALDPCMAGVLGVSGHDAELTDYGPEAGAARVALNRRTRAELADLAERPADSAADRRAVRVLREHLDREIEAGEAGITPAALSSLENPVLSLRRSIELLDQGPDTPWPAVLSRLRAMPGSLTGLRATLTGARPVSARRQVLICAAQCEEATGYLTRLTATYDGPLRGELDLAVAAANLALTGTAAFLRDRLAPRAAERDALGRDRYELGARYFTGARLDPEEVYAWGWEELDRLDREIKDASSRIAPGRPLPEVIGALDRDPRHRISGRDNFRAWTQELADHTIAELDGVHFDIPPPLRRIECRIAPTRGAVYYLPPSDDLVRPGQVWWTMTGEETPTWMVPSTMFHEGVPGHHLQEGMTVCNAGRLNRFQRTLSEWSYSGHVEGWGLYAERLMGELGYYRDPAHHLGLLVSGQWIRAARIVLDIGLHLELRIPKGTGFHEGRRWGRELGMEFLRTRGFMNDDFSVRYEIDRYLGLPGQAVSYKVGERAWLGIRAAARRRLGPAFDLKTFHATVLDLGPMGLDTLADEMSPPAT